MLRSLLLLLAKSRRFARFVTGNSFARRCARRFIAGDMLHEAVAVVRELNSEGISATIDFLGEHVTSADGAQRVSYVCLDLVEAIANEKLDANVSVKLSQLGLDVDPKLCEGLLKNIVTRAELRNSFVRVDMEGSAYAEQTINIVERVREHSHAVGPVIQAYLYRSELNVVKLLHSRCPMRLCKGAYKEPSRIAYQRKKEVDANFVHLMQILLKSGIYHGIATHDKKIIDQCIEFSQMWCISKKEFEFQMLYGIRRDLQKDLVRRGYKVRVYVPFGNQWFPYFMRRLAERPANLWFFLRSALRA